MSLKTNPYLAQYQNSAPPKPGTADDGDDGAANDESIELEFGDDDFASASLEQHSQEVGQRAGGKVVEDETPPPSQSLQPKGPSESLTDNGSSMEGQSFPVSPSNSNNTTFIAPPPQRRSTLQGGGGGGGVKALSVVVMSDEGDDDDAFGGDWDAVNTRTETAQEKARKEDPSGIAKPTSFIESYIDIWKNQEKMWRKYEGSDRFNRIHASVETGGFWGCLWGCMHCNIVEHTIEYDERDFVLCLMQVPLERNTTHHRILMSLYRKAMKPKRSDPDPASVGAHWERDLGFQGDNPGTDLRTQGIFGLLQMLQVFDGAPLFADKLHQASQNPIASFGFSLICLFFSGVSIEAMQKRLLNDEIVKRSKAKKLVARDKELAAGASSSTTGGEQYAAYGSAQVEAQWAQVVVAEVICDFHLGALYHFYLEWTKESVQDAHAFPTMKNKLKAYATDHSAEMIKNAAIAKNRQTWTGKSNRKKEPVASFSTLDSSDKNKGF